MRDPLRTPVMGLVTPPLSILPPLTPNVIVTLSLAWRINILLRWGIRQTMAALYSDDWSCLSYSECAGPKLWPMRCRYWMVIKLSYHDFMNESRERGTFLIPFLSFFGVISYSHFSVGDATECGKRDCGELFKHHTTMIYWQRHQGRKRGTNALMSAYFAPLFHICWALRKAWCY